MAKGFRFMPLAQCMGYLGATLTQVFMRVGWADVSLRDVTIAQMGNGARECGWRHAPEARGGFWGFWKSQLSSASGEDGWLLLAHQSQASGLVAGATRVGGGRWKSHHRKIVHLSSLYWRTFKLKGNKKFCTRTKKS